MIEKKLVIDLFGNVSAKISNKISGGSDVFSSSLSSRKPINKRVRTVSCTFLSQPSLK